MSLFDLAYPREYKSWRIPSIPAPTIGRMKEGGSVPYQSKRDGSKMKITRITYHVKLAQVRIHP
jgi:hypothetical protein